MQAWMRRMRGSCALCMLLLALSLLASALYICRYTWRGEEERFTEAGLAIIPCNNSGTSDQIPPAACPAQTDLFGAYRGRYGDCARVRKATGEMETLTLKANGQLYFADAQADTDRELVFIVESANTDTRATGSTIYINDYIKLRDSHSGKYLSAGPSGTVSLSSTSSPLELRLEPKYGVPDTEWCNFTGPASNHPDYAENRNNRHKQCQFPYVDCFARCAKRRFKARDGRLLQDDGSHSHRAVMKSTGDWSNYELVLS